MTNLNLLFNKLYYQKIKTSEFKADIEENNKKIFSTRFNHETDYKKCEIPGCCPPIILKTTYPGTLIGHGNPHGVSENYEKGKPIPDIKSGFSFDYTTGQPYIPGSSVKGMLRSHFTDHPKAIVEALNCDFDTVNKLEKEIFDGNDIFLDAVIFDGDKNGKILGADYITPHTKPHKDPTPIFIIKILPDVRLEFRFILKDGIISASEKRCLFALLLSKFGIGAKTNVGYGNLDYANDKILSKNG